MTPHFFFFFFTFLTWLTHHLTVVKVSEKNQCWKVFARTSLNGNRNALVQSVKAGADVRYVVENITQGYAYKAQNLALSPDRNHVTAQAVNQIIMRSIRSRNKKEMKQKVYTGGSQSFLQLVRWIVSRCTVGQHTGRGHTSQRIGQKWFVNH